MFIFCNLSIKIIHVIKFKPRYPVDITVLSVIENLEILNAIILVISQRTKIDSINITIIYEISRFILKYDKELKLKLQKLKKVPKEEGSYEYGSFRWLLKKIKKEFKVWNIGSKLSSGGIPVTFMDGKYHYS